MIKRINEALPFLFLSFVFTMVVFSFRDNPFSNVLSGHDSSMFLYFGKGISKGLIPYKDMLDHKGPVLFIIQYFSVLIGFGNISLGIWLVECFFLLASLVFLYKTCCLYTGNKVISATALVFLLPLLILCYDGGNYSEEFALLFINISFYLFSKIVLQQKISQVEYVLIGIFGAATFFIRVNMISLWAVFCLFLCYMDIQDKKIVNLVAQVKGIFIGGISATLLVILLSLFQNNLKEMFQQAFTMNFLYSESDLLGKINTIIRFTSLLLKTGLFPFIVIYFVSFFAKNKKLQNRIYFVLSTYFIVNFLTVILSGRYYTHYFITQFAPLAVILALSIQFITSIVIQKRKTLSLFILMITILPATVSSFKTYNWAFNTHSSVETNQIESLAKYISQNTINSDTIYVHNINANIYLLSNRYSNSRFFVLPSVNYDNFPKMKNEFSKKMDSNPPKFIVVRRQLLEDTRTSSNLNNEVFNVIEDKYHQVDEIKSDSYLLYEICK